jgi:CRP/FNR family putative post-exponential-phase nitrogen-starvation transcriptional regulator
MRTHQTATHIQDYVEQFHMADFLNKDLLNRLELFHFPAYANVLIEQDQPHYLYFLVEGQVQCHHYHLNGKLAVFAVSNPFTAIGDLEVLNDTPVHSNVIATRDTKMLGLSSEAINYYGANDSRFLRFLIDELRLKLYKTNSFQANQQLPVISRLAVYLLSQPVNESGTMTLPYKEAVASLLGTSFRHLNRVFRTLIDTGTITMDYPSVRVLNFAQLESWISETD